MDISNINGISTGDIKSFFNNTSLTKTDKTDSFRYTIRCCQSNHKKCGGKIKWMLASI